MWAAPEVSTPTLPLSIRPSRRPPAITRRRKISVKGLKGGPLGHPDHLPARQRQQGVVPLPERCAVRRCWRRWTAAASGTPFRAKPRPWCWSVPKEYDGFVKALKAYEKVVKAEYASIEDAVSVKVKEVDKPAEMLPKEVAANLIKGRGSVPRRGAEDVDGHARAGADLDEPRARGLGRQDREAPVLAAQFGGHGERGAGRGHRRRLRALAGAKTELTGSYDGWNPDMESPILKAMTASYEALYGKKPAVTAIHAGLECGIIGSKYPKMDMISFGPTICYPPLARRKVEIASVGKVLRLPGGHAAQHSRKISAAWQPILKPGSSSSTPWPEAAAGSTTSADLEASATRTSANRSSRSTSSTPRNSPCGPCAAYRRIIVVGGDGTLHEVVNGLFIQQEVCPATCCWPWWPWARATTGSARSASRTAIRMP